tara:strand:- start:304 stop:558 length:255 start_codon:yes stop_codon:yes gene_type:complete
MIIQKNNSVCINKRGRFIDGTITDISIALTPSDPAGENGVQVEQLDIDMNYKGSISYKTNNDQEYWAYFDQIVEVDGLPRTGDI